MLSLIQAVRKDNKQRLSLLEEGEELLIRANQGHSIKVIDIYCETTIYSSQ
jgi:RNA:NAD 2'-phosphotransferase (TPT1/KptA family)